MYYVKTETPDYTITTSYATLSQAEQYGGLATAGELHLVSDGCTAIINNVEDGSDLKDMINLGRVRTVLESHVDPSEENAGRYMLYILDEDEWTYSGIDFSEYGDANKFLKLKSMRGFGDMAIVENPHVSQARDSRGRDFSIDLNPPRTPSKLEYVTGSISELTRGIYED
jgi:hypothetical protein